MRRPLDDRGSAIIEFVFAAVIVMVPLVYLVVAVAGVQRSQLAVSQAAREAGRAYATSDSSSTALPRARAALALSLHDQGLSDDARLVFVAAGEGCASPPITPRLEAGAEFTVCVTRRAGLPGFPRILTGRAITSTGEYVVHVDDYRSVS